LCPTSGAPPQTDLEDFKRHFQILGIGIVLNDHCELNDRPSICAPSRS
jgi:hypothetical protein